MAQIVRQIDYGEKIGQGVNASLERLINEKARKIEEKHAYERNLEFLKGANIPNAEQVAHGSNDQILQLLKGGSTGSPAVGNQRYNDLLSQYTGAEQQPLQQGQQQEVDYDNPTPEVYARPEVQEALMNYMQSPEVQQKYTPEQLVKVQQKLQSYAQQGQSQQLMGQLAPQQDQNRLYEQLLASAPLKELPRIKALRELKEVPAGETKDLTPIQKLKHEQDTQKKIEAKKHVQKAYDRVNEILDSGYTGYSLTGLTPEGRKLRSELDTLSEVYISNLIPLLNPKGTMSKERFNYIKNLAPNSFDTDAAIKGKQEALREIFDLKGSSPKKTPKGTIEMIDSSGEIYDIPEDQVEKAKKAGLK